MTTYNASISTTYSSITCPTVTSTNTTAWYGYPGPAAAPTTSWGQTQAPVYCSACQQYHSPYAACTPFQVYGPGNQYNSPYIPAPVVFLIGGVAFRIPDFDSLLFHVSADTGYGVETFDYRVLDKVHLHKIADVLMRYALLGECMQIPVLLFLAIYTLINGREDDFLLVQSALIEINMASAKSPEVMKFGPDEGALLRLTVEVAASLEAVSDDE